MEQKNELTQEELAAEQAAMAEAKVEEVTASVVEKFGFDEELDADKIEKAVAIEMEHRKNLSHAIGQKIKHREEAEKLRKATPPAKPEVKIDPDEVDKKIDIKMNEALEKRDLDSMDYPEELKAEISRVAKIQGVSVNKVLSDSYIVSKIETYEKKEKNDKATIGRNNKGGNMPEEELDFSSLADFDMSTEEGRKGYDAALAKLKEQEKNRK